MTPLPSIKPEYPREILDGFPPAERLAAYYGVERKFLRFASPPYSTDQQEQYALHQYASMAVTDSYGDAATVTHDDQYRKAVEILDSGVLWCDPPGLVIINSPYYFFNSSDSDPDGGAEAFLAHLLCSLALRVHQRKASSDINVNFLEMLQIDPRQYIIKPKHLLLWGVCTEHLSAYDCSKTIQFLHSFRNHTRILLTSVSDMGELLDLLHIHLSHVTALFNLDRRQEMMKDEARKAKLTKKSKPKPKRQPIEKTTTTSKKTASKKTKTVQKASREKDSNKGI